MMTRYKVTRSRKEEFDDWWDGFMTESGATPEQIEHIKQQSAEFMQKSREFAQIIDADAKAGRHEGESLEDFKKRKLSCLDIRANAINNLSD